MVNEERLRHMVKMAKFDKNDGKKCKPMIQYARTDYVALHLLISFVTGSLCYALLIGAWVLRSAEDFLEQLNQIDIRSTLTSLAVSYLVFMAIYLGATSIVYNVKYTAGRKRVKQYYADVKRVNQMYEREERLRVNDNQDWD